MHRNLRSKVWNDCSILVGREANRRACEDSDTVIIGIHASCESVDGGVDFLGRVADKALMRGGYVAFDDEAGDGGPGKGVCVVLPSTPDAGGQEEGFIPPLPVPEFQLRAGDNMADTTREELPEESWCEL